MSLLKSKYFVTHTDTVNEKILRDKETYEAYKAYCKRQKVADRNIIKNQPDFNVALSAITKTMANLIVEKKNGLFLKDFGYFFVFRSYGHTYSRRRDGKKYFKLERGGLRARIIFMPDRNDFHLKFWTFENRFVRKLQVEVMKRTDDGFRYIGLPYTITNLLHSRSEDIYKNYPKKLLKDE